jgi:hypothetical protein
VDEDVIELRLRRIDLLTLDLHVEVLLLQEAHEVSFVDQVRFRLEIEPFADLRAKLESVDIRTALADDDQPGHLGCHLHGGGAARAEQRSGQRGEAAGAGTRPRHGEPP